MCIVLVKKKDQTFEPDLIERMYDMGNRDGFGMMWVEEARVKTEKSMGFASSLKSLYKDRMDNDIAVHVRNATFGGKNVENCHPYCVLDVDLGHKIDLYMMHNGTIREVQVDKTMSDSFNFATKFLRPLLAKGNNYKMIYDESFQNFLSGVIGPNKLVFLDNKKQFIIVNADLGSYHSSGCWVSTKNEIKIIAPFVPIKSPYQPPIHHETQTSYSAWDYQKGKWQADSDLRLHFFPDSALKGKDEEADATTNDQQEGGIDNGILSGSDEVDENGFLERILKGMPGMKRVDVFSFVKDYPAETLNLLRSIDTEHSEKDLKKMIKSDVWGATEALIKASKEKYGTPSSVALN